MIDRKSLCPDRRVAVHSEGGYKVFMPELELRHLRAVRTIAEEGSVTRAATRLGLTQPALSAQLRTVERLVGGQLFDRTRSGCVPTDLGRRVLGTARLVLDEMAQLMSTTRATGRGGPLFFGCIPILYFARLVEGLRVLNTDVRAEVTAVLDAQVAAWNRGDLEAFCATYAADASFASPTGLVRGRDAVLARYKTKYPDAASRGTLSFTIEEARQAAGLEVTPFGLASPGEPTGASILARWTLTYAGKPPATGLTLIVLRPRRAAGDGQPKWEIVQDASM